MNLQPRIQTIAQKWLIGTPITMSIANNKTRELWQNFMPRRKEIKNSLNTDLISMQVYDDALDFKDFTPNTPFQKWAAVEVTDHTNAPKGMQTFTLPGGVSAVFNYKGAASAFAPTFKYIFYEWLPQSGYELDKRPHFEVLGAKYKNEDPESEEEIWVPVKQKSLN
nr:GyrI-like domain-containing protein [Mucilaginibacter sp. L294]